MATRTDRTEPTDRTGPTDRPDAVLGEPDLTVLPSDEFDRLLRWLDEPDEPMPKIAQAAAREREHPTFIEAEED
jgi:hypothetical protein